MNNKTIFIHIPKNGGMCIRNATELKNKIIVAGRENHINAEYSDMLLKTMNKYGEHHGYEHARWRDINKTLRAKYDAFAIIRNPWSKVISRYTFALISKTIPKDTTLEQFLEERHTYGNVPYFWHRAIKGWYQQLDHVTDETGKLRCDILRFEYFDYDTMKYHDIKKPLKIRNVSNGTRNDIGTIISGRVNYTEFYNSTTIDIVADWYKDDIKYFGFTFENAATKNIWNKNDTIG